MGGMRLKPFLTHTKMGRGVCEKSRENKKGVDRHEEDEDLVEENI